MIGIQLDDAKEQVEDIKVARNFIESLFEGEFVCTNVTRENEEEALAEETAQQQELEEAEEPYDSTEDTDWNSNNSGSWNNWGNAGNSWTPPPATPQETEQPSSQDGATGNPEETGDSTSGSEDSIPEDPAPKEEESSTEE